MLSFGSFRCVVVPAAGVALLTALLPGTASSAAGGHAWARTDIGAISQPAPVGSRFVLYAHRGGSLEVVALNAGDGSTAWTVAASPSHVTAGVSAELAVRGGTVFYLAGAPGPIGTAKVIARDVASARVVWQSAAGDFMTWPRVCADEVTAVCVNGAVPGIGWGELRYSAANGRLLGPVKIGTTGLPGRELGIDLFDPGTRSPETILSISKGRVAWRRPLSEIFTLPHASSDGGWNFDRFTGLFVGSVGVRPTIANGKATIDLGVSMTAGFALGNGRVIWRTAGLYSCGQPLPCPGRAEDGYSSPAEAAGSSPSVGLRIVEKGHATFSVNGGTPKISADASATIQGFDPATGKTTWSFDAGRNTGLISSQVVPARIDQDSIVVTNRSGHLVALDLRNGATRQVPASTRAWCEQSIQYHLSNAAYYGGKSGLYIGQQGLFPCTLGGRRAGIPTKLPSFVGRIGATTEGLTAWTDMNAVRAEPT